MEEVQSEIGPMRPHESEGRGGVHATPEKSEKPSFISTVRPTVDTNPSRKRSFSKTLLKI